MTITWRDIRNQAEEIAAGLVREAVDDGKTTKDEIGEYLDDRLYETIGRHEWTIYTAKAWEVVKAARDDRGMYDAAYEELEALQGNVIGKGEDIDSLMTRLAYCVLRCACRDAGWPALYSAGWNMPGYMPDSDPALFSTAKKARGYLKETLVRHADEDLEAMEEGSEQYQALAGEYEQAILSLSEGEGEFSRQIGQYVYWVSEAEAE